MRAEKKPAGPRSVIRFLPPAFVFPATSGGAAVPCRRAPSVRPDTMIPPPGTEKPLTHDELAAWQSQTVRDTWRVFRIMAEFVEGFETLSRIGPCVTIFGSARTTSDSPEYQLACDVARAAAERGYGVITGGGPGIMEAANRGAFEADGISVGLNIALPFEQASNGYIHPDKLVNFDFFFVRKVMLVKYAQAVIVLPGGFGTLDELFESLTLVQTDKATPFPIVLMGTSFWSGLIDWLRGTVLAMGNISEKDFDLFTLTDDPVEALQAIDRFYDEHATLRPNF